MCHSRRGVGLFGLRGWHMSIVLFLAFLVPVTPLLAEIHSDATYHAAETATSPVTPVAVRGHISSYVIALDLFGLHSPDNPAPAWLLPAPGTSACLAGKTDADNEVDGTFWFILSTFISLWGVLLAYLISPSVPDANLKGKSSSYATSYAQCYQDKAQSIHVKWAWYGSLASIALYGLVLLVIMAANGGAINN
jgi:hypothetical protein